MSSTSAGDWSLKFVDVRGVPAMPVTTPTCLQGGRSSRRVHQHRPKRHCPSKERRHAVSRPRRQTPRWVVGAVSSGRRIIQPASKIAALTPTSHSGVAPPRSCGLPPRVCSLHDRRRIPPIVTTTCSFDAAAHRILASTTSHRTSLAPTGASCLATYRLFSLEAGNAS